MLNTFDLNATMQTLGSPIISNPGIFLAAKIMYSRVENMASEAVVYPRLHIIRFPLQLTQSLLTFPTHAYFLCSKLRN